MCSSKFPTAGGPGPADPGGADVSVFSIKPFLTSLRALLLMTADPKDRASRHAVSPPSSPILCLGVTRSFGNKTYVNRTRQARAPAPAASQSSEAPIPFSPASPAEARLSLSTLRECPTQAVDGACPSPAPSEGCSCASGRSPGADAGNEHESSGSPSFHLSVSPAVLVEQLIENLPRQERPRHDSVMSDDTVMLDTDVRTPTTPPTVAGIVPIDLETVTVTSTSTDGEPALPESPLITLLGEPPLITLEEPAAAGLCNGQHPGTAPSLSRRPRRAAKRPCSLDRCSNSSSSSSSCEPPDAAGPSHAPSTSRRRKKAQQKRSSASAPGSLPPCWVLVKRCDE